MPEVLFFVAHDSQFKWAAAASHPFRREGWRVRYFAPAEHTRISEAQIADAGVLHEEVIRAPGYQILGHAVLADALIFATPGGITERFLYALRDQCMADPSAPRPVIATAYVGMVIDNPVGGFLFRAPADLVCVNSRHDLEVFQDVSRELGLPEDGLVVTGLSIVGGSVQPQKVGPIRQVLFADQVALPASTADRKYIYQSLVNYALRHPDRRVIIKPRHRPDEGSFHKGKFPPERFFANRPGLPANLIVDYTPISELLPETDLLLTLSSTAALEAVAHGVRTAIIADIGVREVHGNMMFVGSGLIRTFAQISSDNIGRPDPVWLARFQHQGEEPVEAIFAAVSERVARLRAGALPLPQAPYFDARRQSLADPYGFRIARKVTSRKANIIGLGRRKIPGAVRSALRAVLPSVVVLPLYRLGRRIGVI